MHLHTSPFAKSVEDEFDTFKYTNLKETYDSFVRSKQIVTTLPTGFSLEYLSLDSDLDAVKSFINTYYSKGRSSLIYTDEDMNYFKNTDAKIISVKHEGKLAAILILEILTYRHGDKLIKGGFIDTTCVHPKIRKCNLFPFLVFHALKVTIDNGGEILTANTCNDLKMYELAHYPDYRITLSNRLRPLNINTGKVYSMFNVPLNNNFKEVTLNDMRFINDFNVAFQPIYNDAMLTELMKVCLVYTTGLSYADDTSKVCNVSDASKVCNASDSHATPNISNVQRRKINGQFIMFDVKHLRYNGVAIKFAIIKQHINISVTSVFIKQVFNDLRDNHGVDAVIFNNNPSLKKFGKYFYCVKDDMVRYYTWNYFPKIGKDDIFYLGSKQ